MRLRRAGHQCLCRQDHRALDNPGKKEYGGTSRCDSRERRGERLGVLGAELFLPTSGSHYYVDEQRERAARSLTVYLSISTPLWRHTP